MNKVILLGNLTRDPELRYSTSGVAIAKFGLASNRRFKQGDDLKEEVCFVDVTVFGKRAESLPQYIRKGSKVLIDGRLQQERWETEDGQKRSKHAVVAESVTFLDKAGQGDGEQAEKDKEWGPSYES